MNRRLVAAFLLGIISFFAAAAQSQPHGSDDPQLKYVVYMTRHGVRSPTGKLSQYQQYSNAAWPTWDVPPGYLTPHGFQLMQLMGSYDRALLNSQGLLPDAGCSADVTFYADSDERTQETGKALAKGLFPGCDLPVHGLPQGENDPLFHPAASSITPADAALATAAIAGRVGNDPTALAEAYRSQLTELDTILATCGKPEARPHTRTSLFDIPATLSTGSGDHAAELRGPLSTAATLTENLLLEFTEGMDTANVGWGCVDAQKLRALIDLHTASSDIAQRTPVVARLQASNLLTTIASSIEQAAMHRPLPRAQGNPTDRALFLVGHDTNLSNLAGLLNLSWLQDGRRDDTPPGSTLAFELWQSPKTKQYSVRLFFMAQTLEQMRAATPLTLQQPPPRVPVFIPGCSRADLSCPLPAFLQLVHRSTTSDEQVTSR